MIHQLKCEARWYDAIRLGVKRVELRRDDRHYEVNDVLDLTEIDNDRPTGRGLCVRVTHIVRASDGPWLAPGYVALSIA